MCTTMLLDKEKKKRHWGLVISQASFTSTSSLASNTLFSWLSPGMHLDNTNQNSEHPDTVDVVMPQHTTRRKQQSRLLCTLLCCSYALRRYAGKDHEGNRQLD